MQSIGIGALKAKLPARVLRAGFRIGLAAAVVVIGCESLQTAAANGDTRTISLHHVHSGESLTITYKRDGRYDEDALKKLNWLLRDWRRNEAIRMDPLLIDLVWEASREAGATRPIEVIGGYRAPATNSMLRARSSGVAENSQHTHGRAMDFFIPGVPLERLREIGLRFQRGGVGFYPTSGSPFVHMDVGSVRHWPRMTHDQLVRVFPDGRTVHVPSDGKPLRGYALALADVERRGRRPNNVSLAAARRAGVDVAAVERAAPRGGNVLADLFGFGSKDDTTASTTATDAPAATAPRTPKTTVVASAAPADKVALPRANPFAKSTAVAAADTTTAAPALPRSRPPFQLASALPAELGQAGHDHAGHDHAGHDHGPDDTLMAYAPLPDSSPDIRASSLTTPPQQETVRLPRPAPGFAHTAARPALARAPVAPSTIATSTFVAATSQVGKAGQVYEDPWLRAAILTPSMFTYMSMSSLSAEDPHGLAAFMGTPATVLAMSFSHDPRQGLAAHAFTGRAVTFVATLPRAKARTAALY